MTRRGPESNGINTGQTKPMNAIKREVPAPSRSIMPRVNNLNMARAAQGRSLPNVSNRQLTAIPAPKSHVPRPQPSALPVRGNSSSAIGRHGAIARNGNGVNQLHPSSTSHLV